eukprot:1152272-Pelagomonas_calceolata.AAC.10
MPDLLGKSLREPFQERSGANKLISVLDLRALRCSNSSSTMNNCSTPAHAQPSSRHRSSCPILLMAWTLQSHPHASTCTSRVTCTSSCQPCFNLCCLNQDSEALTHTHLQLPALLGSLLPCWAGSSPLPGAGHRAIAASRGDKRHAAQESSSQILRGVEGSLFAGDNSLEAHGFFQPGVERLCGTQYTMQCIIQPCMEKRLSSSTCAPGFEEQLPRELVNAQNSQGMSSPVLPVALRYEQNAFKRKEHLILSWSGAKPARCQQF